MPRRSSIEFEAIGFAADDPLVTRPMRREHAHSEVELNFVVGDGMRYLFSGRAVTLPAGRWIASWAALPHGVLAVERPCTLLWVTVPLATTLAWDERGALAQELLRGAVVIEPAAQPGAEARGRDWVTMIRARGERRRIATLELEALVRRLALARRQLVPPTGAPMRSRPRPGGDRAQAAAEVMAGWLAERYRDPVDFADCATSA